MLEQLQLALDLLMHLAPRRMAAEAYGSRDPGCRLCRLTRNVSIEIKSSMTTNKRAGDTARITHTYFRRRR